MTVKLRGKITLSHFLEARSNWTAVYDRLHSSDSANAHSVIMVKKRLQIVSSFPRCNFWSIIHSRYIFRVQPANCSNFTFKALNCYLHLSRLDWDPGLILVPKTPGFREFWPGQNRNFVLSFLSFFV